MAPGVQGSASFDCSGTLEDTRIMGERIANAFTEPQFAGQMLELGWADKAELEGIVAFWRAWGEDPDAFYARAAGEAIGWKE